MAVIDARTSSAIVDLRNTDDWDRLLADSRDTAGTSVSYNGTDNDLFDLDFNGTGLTAGAGFTDALTGGTVTSIDNDLDGASGEDIFITGLNLAAAGLNDTVEGMWLAVLADDDTFYAADDFTSYMFGDALTVAASTILNGGDDMFIGGDNAQSLFYGDAYVNDGLLIGGDDVITGTSGSGGDGFRTSGDAATNNGILIGGNDTMIGTGAVVFVGDVDIAAAGSTTFGGDDIMSFDNGTVNNQVMLGDVTRVRTEAAVIGGDDIMTGSDSNDQIAGDANNIENYGYLEAGDDVINGGAGNDSIAGDIFSNSSFGRMIAGNDLIHGDDGNDIIYGDVFGGSDAIILSGGNDTLYGDAGIDSIFGSFGDDFISGGADADTLNGGSGFDTADYSDSLAGVTVRLFNGTGLGGDAEGDTLVDFEAVNGSAFADTLIGASTTDDTLFGDDGDDSLLGLAGNDTLIGGAGADTLDGGASLFDVADYSTSDAGVTVRLFNNVNVGGDAQGDMISNVEGITGSDFNDTLIGSSTQIDTIRGGDGNDALFGLAGNDTLNGGAGADVIDGGASNKDTVDYSDASAGVTIRLFNGTGEGAEAEGDTISNVERVVGSDHNDILIGANALTDFLVGGNGLDSLFGLSGNDFLNGDAGNDNLDGGAGADRLFGGTGDDAMTGGTESDTFFFEDDSGNDSITDFQNGVDFMDVSGITGITSVADFVSIGQVGNDVVVQIDADNSITIENILVGNIDPTDFIFA